MTEHSSYHQELASAVLLGHANAAQIDEFDTLYTSDESFRSLVGEMEQFLAPLNALTPEAEPPDGLLDDIMRSIEAEDGATAAASGAGALASAGSSASAAPQHRSQHRPQAAPQRPWQFATAAAAAIAVGAIALHFVPDTTVPDERAPETAREELLALMSGDEAPSVVVLLYDKETNTISGRLTNAQLPDDGVWQLWLLREGIDAPQSLGLLQELSANGSINLSVATELAAGSDTLAISVEPVGGSPESGPTGPIVFTGAVNPV